MLQAGKTLLVPTPRLRSGLFNKITPPEEPTKDILRICSTSQVTHTTKILHLTVTPSNSNILKSQYKLNI